MLFDDAALKFVAFLTNAPNPNANAAPAGATSVAPYLTGSSPARGFATARAAAQRRAAPFCAVRFPRADHQLREPGADRLQQLWRWLDQAAGAAPPQPGATIPLQHCATWQADAAQP